LPFNITLTANRLFYPRSRTRKMNALSSGGREKIVEYEDEE